MLNTLAERIAGACTGLEGLKTDGKLLAVFGVSLLWLLLSLRAQTARGRQLTCYSAAAGALCVFPLTAAVLMTYQTGFYDYRWIWACVPVTALIAYGGVLAAERLRSIERRRAVCAVIAIGAVLVLCSGLGSARRERQDDSAECAAVQTALDELQESFYQQQAEDQDIVLWAPEEVLRYARALDGSVQLLYGRNLADNELNAYAYDSVSEEQSELREWMDEEPAEAREGTEAHVAQAFSLGANCVLLDDLITDSAVAEIEAHTGWNVIRLEEYWLVINAVE